MEEKLQQILDYYGIFSQTDKAIEELTELTLALIRYKTNPCAITLDHCVDEIADTSVVITQFIMFHDLEKDVELIKTQKIRRTLRSISEIEKG